MSEANPYQPPQAAVEDIFEPGDAGGTLEAGIAGDYDFRIGEVLKEAWDRTRGLKGAFWGAAAIIFIGMMVLSSIMGFFLLGNVTPGQSSQPGMALAQFVMHMGITVLLYPFILGMIMLGVRRSVDLPVSFTMAFGYMGMFARVLVAAVLMTLITTLGFMLLVLPGIYLSMGYVLVLPLLADKGLGAWQAMEASRRAVTRHWFRIFFLFLAMGVITMISAIPFGIGLIWTYPMMINVMGILYREVFGVELARAAA